MKYWRGYLTAAIIAALTWGVTEFAKNHQALVDMVYPYLSRMIQTALADWSAGLNFCLWQLLVILLVAAFIASIVVSIVLRWNIIQWLGWVLTGVSLIWMLHTGAYGLNYYAGPLAEDIRLNVTKFSTTELVRATTYFRDEANRLALEVPRDENGDLAYPSFEELAESAPKGFEILTYEHSFSIFAGSLAPVKKLGWADLYTSMGIDGITMGLTGEAAVNPNIPVVSMGFVMSHELAHRLCVAREDDAHMAAFLACNAHTDPIFQYSANFMAFRFCYNALAAQTTSAAKNAAKEILNGLNDAFREDLTDYQLYQEQNIDEDAYDLAASFNDSYIKASGDENGVESYAHVSTLLVSWHVQEIYMPEHKEEQDIFDPTDRNQVDLGDGTNG